MKVFLLLLGLAAASRFEATVNPVQKVVNLFKDMKATLMSEIKGEDAALAEYECWARTVKEDKTASNAVAEARNQAIDTELGALEGDGRTGMDASEDLTGERGELKADLDEAKANMEKLKADRKAQRKAYSHNYQELSQTLEATEAAIAELAAGMQAEGDQFKFDKSAKVKKSKHDAFLAVGKKSKRDVRESIAAVLMTEGSHNLENFEQLRIMFNADPDFNKLNKASEATKKYSARSGKIMSMMNELAQNTQTGFDDLQKAEKDNKEAFTKAFESQEATIDQAKDAYNNMAGETAARNKLRSNLKDEKKANEDQIKADDKFMETTEKDLKNHQKLAMKRKKIRMGEVAAVDKAVGILNSDENRDLFSKSHKSQVGLLEEVEKCTPVAMIQKVTQRMRQNSKSSRVMGVAVQMLLATRKPQNTNVFDKVTAKIDEMVTMIDAEQADDEDKKEDCEKERTQTAASMYQSSKDWDLEDDTMKQSDATTEEMNAAIKEANDEIDRLNAELNQLEKERTDENAQYKADKADDEAAATVLKQTYEVMEAYYSKQGMETGASLSLTQWDIQAGKAPPPPPKMAHEDGDYEGGAAGGSIMSMISTLYKGVNDDIARSDKNEKANLEEYNGIVKDMEDQKNALANKIDDLNKTKTEAGKKHTAAEQDRNDDGDAIDGEAGHMDKVNPGCDYRSFNFARRTDNRRSEKDGLLSAKTVLEAAAASMNPKDSFLQTATLAAKFCQ